ncbi:MAG: BrnT family toxin [Spirochaetota bacterium]
MITFQWDQPKAMANLKKHGISFEEAQSVFYDEFAIQFYDDGHSSIEERFLMLGMSSSARVLVVCHCEREAGDVIRIFSARRATRRESTFYGGELP